MSNIINRFVCRLRPRYWHNRVYPMSLVLNKHELGIEIHYSELVQFVSWVNNTGIQTNQPAHVILSGPSIQQIEDPRLLSNGYCVAVNGSAKLLYDNNLVIDAYIVDDPNYIIERLTDFLNFAANAVRVFVPIRIVWLLISMGVDIRKYRIHTYDYYRFPAKETGPQGKPPFFSLDSYRKIGTCDTVAFVALQILAIMGFKQIALFGMDLSMEGRFYSENKVLPQYIDKNWHHGILEPFKLASRLLKERNIKVANCSQASKLPEHFFPKVNPNIYLKNMQTLHLTHER